MIKIKEVYNLEINENLEIEFEMNNRGNITVTRAEENIYHEDIEFDECTYCKPNIRFSILPQYDIEEQVRYHLAQRDRISKIQKLIDSTKTMLRERNIR